MTTNLYIYRIINQVPSYKIYTLLGTFKITYMVHIISFLVKVIMTLVFAATCGAGLIVLAIVFWDERYMHIASKVQNEYIWGGREE